MGHTATGHTGHQTLIPTGGGAENSSPLPESRTLRARPQSGQLKHMRTSSADSQRTASHSSAETQLSWAGNQYQSENMPAIVQLLHETRNQNRVNLDSTTDSAILETLHTIASAHEAKHNTILTG